MPVYELRCADGHRFEVLQPFSADLPPCTCGAATAKVPSAFGTAGSAQLPPPPSHMPQTWRGTYGGDRGYLTHLQRTAERRRTLEDRNPELRGDRRPVVAHEGRFADAPLRAGDAPPDGGGASPGGAASGTHTRGGGAHGHG